MEEISASETSLSDEQKRIQELVINGKELYDAAKDSNFENHQDILHLITSLKYLTQAAGEHSTEAISYIKPFFIEDEVPDRVTKQLPADLLAVAHMLMEGTKEEKEIYSVARDMFVVMSKGNDFIKRDDFLSAVDRLVKEEERNATKHVKPLGNMNRLKSSVKRILHCGLSTNEKGERITTQEAFCLVACRYARGETLMQSLEDETAAELSSEQLSDFKKSNWIKKATDFPSETSHFLGRYVLSTIEKYGVRWIWSLFPIRQFFLVLLVYLIPLINVHFMLSLLATLVFTASLLAMVITTLQVVANSTKVSSFEEYSTIFTYFSRHGQDINTRDPEVKLILRSAFPYLTFGLSILATMFSIRVAYQQVLVYELLLIVAGAMATVVFFQFGVWKSPLMILTLSTRLLSWGLVLMHVFQTWLPIPDFVFALGWTMFSIPIFPGFYVNINVITLLQVPLHVMLVCYFVIKYSWKNFFIGLGPYLLFISWWIFTRYIFNHSSIISLIIFIPGVISVLLFIPFLPLLIVMAPFIVMLYYGVSIQFLLSLTLLGIASIVALVVMYNYQNIKNANWLNIPFDYVLLIQFIIGLVLMFIGTLYYNSLNAPSPSSVELLQFKDYNNMCGLDVSLPGNTVQSQLDCLHLKGRTVFVEEAIVKGVTLSSVTNSHLSALKNFPESVGNALVCLMGETVPFCGKLANSKTCVFKGCHFDRQNYYTITITVQLPLSSLLADLNTEISHMLLLNSSLLKLKRDDLITFNGTLQDGMGTERLAMKLKSYSSSYSDLDYEYNINGTMEGTKQQLMTRAWESFVVTAGLIVEIAIGYSPSEYYKT